MLSIIVAMDKNRLIGSRTALPWRLPADLAHFKAITLGHPIIMGRRTFDSIGKPLPGRRNIVLTGQPLEIPGIEVFPSIEEPLRMLAEEGEEEVFIIGGATVYEQALPFVKKMYITKVDGEFQGDVYFPAVDWSQWKEISSEERAVDEKNAYRMVFTVFEKVSS